MPEVAIREEAFRDRRPLAFRGQHDCPRGASRKRPVRAAPAEWNGGCFRGAQVPVVEAPHEVVRAIPTPRGVSQGLTEGTEMKRNAVVLLGTLTLLACSRDRTMEKTGSTTITGAAADASVTGATGATGDQTPSDKGGTMQGAMQEGTKEHGQADHAGQPLQAGASHTKNTDAIRAHLTKEKVVPATIITSLIITDDGSMVVISGTVPDKSTHDAVLDSAKKTPGVKGVRDDLEIKGE